MTDVRSLARRARYRHRGVHARLTHLEAELQEHRQLNRRVAELTDLVAELVVPLARHETGTVDEILQRYRDSI